MAERQVYPSHPRYRLQAGLGVLVVVLFGWELSRQFSPEGAFFLLIGLGLALINLRWVFTRVELNDTSLTLHEPLATRWVDYRQIVDVLEGERRSRALSLIYYPAGQNGLLDLDQPRTLFLPMMAGQAELATRLRQEMPS
jgi:hypothetical protein